MDDLPVGLTCKHCGKVFGTIFTPITTPLVAACSACVIETMGMTPPATVEDWQEVLKKL